MQQFCAVQLHSAQRELTISRHARRLLATPLCITQKDRHPPTIGSRTIATSPQRNTTPRRKLSPTEANTILELRAKGHSFRDIATQLGRSKDTVRSHYKRSDLSEDGGHACRTRLAFTPEEDSIITTMRAQGFTFKEIGDRPGRPLSTVTSRLSKTMLAKVEGHNRSSAAKSGMPVTDAEISTIFQMRNQGYKRKPIARKLGRTHSAIVNIIHRQYSNSLHAQSISAA